MPEVTVDEADKLMSEAAIEDGVDMAQTPSDEQVPESGEQSEVGATTGDEPADPYADADADKLKDVLKQRDAELMKARKSYTELRSLGDRHHNELKQENAEIRGQLKALMDHIGKPPAKDSAELEKAQKDFDSDWAQQINADPGNGVIAFQRGIGQELEARLEKKLEDKVSKFFEQIRAVNPLYKEHREDIQELVGLGLAEETAMKVVQKLSSKLRTKPSVAQPGQAVAPGRTSGIVRKQSAPSLSPIMLDPFDYKIMKSTGLTDKDIEDIMGKVKKESEG